MNKKDIKVAKIIDENTLVINAGEKQAIKKGDEFQIIGKKGFQPVLDPDTGEDLGTLDEIKGTVIVHTTYPNMSICKSKYIVEEINTHDLSSIQKMSNQMTNITKQLQSGIIKSGHYEDLNVEQGQITGGFQESNDPIRIGDIANPVN